nr:uncharacterized protein LOC129385843 [Dermacentor andersoni]
MPETSSRPGSLTALKTSRSWSQASEPSPNSSGNSGCRSSGTRLANPTRWRLAGFCGLTHLNTQTLGRNGSFAAAAQNDVLLPAKVKAASGDSRGRCRWKWLVRRWKRETHPPDRHWTHGGRRRAGADRRRRPSGRGHKQTTALASNHLQAFQYRLLPSAVWEAPWCWLTPCRFITWLGKRVASDTSALASNLSDSEGLVTTQRVRQVLEVTGGLGRDAACSDGDSEAKWNVSWLVLPHHQKRMRKRRPQADERAKATTSAYFWTLRKPCKLSDHVEVKIHIDR